MKQSLKTIFLLALCCFCSFYLASCGSGIKGSEAKQYIRDFFDAVSAEDYEKAETFLHPAVTDDLELFFQGLEDEKNLAFGSGIEIEKYTGFYSTIYSSEIRGSAYRLSMDTKVGDQTVKFTIEIVKNDEGYGIYNLNLDT